MWLHPESVKKHVHMYISPKLCLTPEIKSKYFRIGECVGIGQTTVSLVLPMHKVKVTFELATWLFQATHRLVMKIVYLK